MADRAPDNQPTASLREMVTYAEQQCSYWTERISHHYRMLESAERVFQSWEQSLNEAQRWLDARLADEATPHIPYLDN